MTAYYRPPTYPATDVVPTAEGVEPLPVLVIGAGPVGLGVALGLVRRGIPVTAVEAGESVSFGSRAICLSRHSLEVSDRLGFGPELEKIVLPWTGGRTHHRDREVLHFQMPHGEHAARPPMVNVSQSEIEQVMVDALLEHPLATLHWSAEVTGLVQDEEAARVTLQTPFGERDLRARWVVAADGGRSTVRRLAGLRMQGTSYEGNYVIADIHWPSELPAERLVWFDAPSNPGSTIIMHRQPRDIWRIDYQLDAADDPAAETAEERIRDRITRHLTWLGSDVPWTLEWHGYYQARALALPDFVHGRVVFAGDAAHLVPIFGVRGLNSGMEDAETLVWQLAEVVRGRADASLLAAYSVERHAAWRQNVDNAGKSTLIMSPGTRGHRLTRDAVLALSADHPEFSHLLNPRQSSATHTHGSPLTWPAAADVPGMRPGDPLEDRRVRRRVPGAPAQETSLHAVRGHGFSVLVAGASPARAAEVVAATRRLADELAPEPVSAVIVPADTDADHPAGDIAGDVAVLDDPAGELAAAWGAEPGEMFVVRPDGQVLARTREPAMLDRVAPQLRAGTAPDPAAGQATGDALQRPVAVSADEAAREQVWLALSSGIDSVAGEGESGGSGVEAFLTRLAMVLGDRVGADEFARCLEMAARAR
ncbi:MULTISPECIES: FAD-dependent monooxygenase [Prauserella salsuginis group]|uniref:FAD-dependent monooxygenase n=1 Tax=Prauserella salsuginis TaxID=387889 RepID=A0ABW6G3W7_9PSEU|nr:MULTISPECIES: FAD-dependent monooxygenase [Prauserella salsuginis group]MCR3718348.1 3-(3-hydroxy-phenyl)propionate hydroxylase [Prauserella flava]MCR3732918.1 3-(3-hydroxy-phenyl)propionate hydroxylase [Prauserella salsuginis]